MDIHFTRTEKSGPSNVGSTFTIDLDATTTRDGYNIVLGTASPLTRDPVHQSDVLSGQPVRCQVTVQAERRKSGLTRILVRTTAMQARESVHPDPCGCSKPSGDYTVTVHTVLTVPADIADRIARLLTTESPAIINAALNVHSLATGVVWGGAGHNVPRNALVDKAFNTIAGTGFSDTEKVADGASITYPEE